MFQNWQKYVCERTKLGRIQSNSFEFRLFEFQYLNSNFEFELELDLEEFDCLIWWIEFCRILIRIMSKFKIKTRKMAHFLNIFWQCWPNLTEGSQVRPLNRVKFELKFEFWIRVSKSNSKLFRVEYVRAWNELKMLISLSFCIGLWLKQSATENLA